MLVRTMQVFAETVTSLIMTQSILGKFHRDRRTIQTTNCILGSYINRVFETSSYAYNLIWGRIRQAQDFTGA